MTMLHVYNMNLILHSIHRLLLLALKIKKAIYKIHFEPWINLMPLFLKVSVHTCVPFLNVHVGEFPLKRGRF